MNIYIYIQLYSYISRWFFMFAASFCVVVVRHPRFKAKGPASTVRSLLAWGSPCKPHSQEAWLNTCVG